MGGINPAGLPPCTHCGALVKAGGADRHFQHGRTNFHQRSQKRPSLRVTNLAGPPRRGGSGTDVLAVLTIAPPAATPYITHTRSRTTRQQRSLTSLRPGALT
jgi:hypothetical protein